MGLAPSNDRDSPAFFGCREVPVPIFSQPLRERTPFRGAKGDTANYPGTYETNI